VYQFLVRQPPERDRHHETSTFVKKLPVDAPLNIFVHAHINANEPATSLQLWQNSGNGLLLVV
jgi:hypothetical protein